MRELRLLFWLWLANRLIDLGLFGTRWYRYAVTSAALYVDWTDGRPCG